MQGDYWGALASVSVAYILYLLLPPTPHPPPLISSCLWGTKTTTGWGDLSDLFHVWTGLGTVDWICYCVLVSGWGGDKGKRKKTSGPYRSGLWVGSGRGMSRQWRSSPPWKPFPIALAKGHSWSVSGSKCGVNSSDLVSLRSSGPNWKACT